MDELDESLELSSAEMHLYSRQILLDGWDIEAQEKLKLAKCTYCRLWWYWLYDSGVTGTCAGVRQITLIDADTIEVSNFQRTDCLCRKQCRFL